MKHLIAFPDLIYNGGGYYDDVVSIGDCFQLNHLSPSPAKLEGVLFKNATRPAADFNIYGSTEEFRTQVRDNNNYIAKTHQVAPQSIALSIENCYLYKGVIYRPAHEGLDVLHETYRSNDRAWTHHLDFENANPNVSVTLDDSSRIYLYIGSVGSSNYGHWLIDDLPRGKYLQQIEHPCTVVLDSFGSAIDAVKTESLRSVISGAEVDFKFVSPNDVVHFPTLHYVTPVSFHPFIKNRFAMDFARSIAEGSKPANPSPKKRLFVERDAARYRRLLNNSDVASLLEGLGFTIVDPEKLSFHEQMNLFAAADVIVGVMCAAMANTIFSPPKSKIIYLSPIDWYEPFYWDLAATMSHDYHAIYGAREGKVPEPFLDDFVIDVDVLRQVIASVP
ncbi:hypothetical protein OPKNFCMD_3042 [Methylobacterium crusticola]|uniref:Glycosyltransferase 61 catalytic domain-containing protein n=1 Tax=Methylobacterium crusticola TaxID=1697972 RepID=A0ABQ4QY39_9HYPH|nr:glycosyltransferase family 61 protein [Methylobacterium crusticola]GJD50303.1 hypothetical protein OPKNFCMD_3042 [Methylobacterium crusticola]